MMCAGEDRCFVTFEGCNEFRRKLEKRQFYIGWKKTGSLLNSFYSTDVYTESSFI